ncbi:growth hormone secretagogue receptor type 1-like [Ptychodera flava]|uniref:growth hormone secretagogue receptor type 1-like n=1 Tax=Ptychodera flava TaxID=63121 RepID=UPI00396A82DF
MTYTAFYKSPQLTDLEVDNMASLQVPDGNSTAWLFGNQSLLLQYEYEKLTLAQEESRGPLAFLWISILLIGVTSNVGFLYVRSRVVYMQTVTNCYLMNLGLADITFLTITVPLETCDLFFGIALRYHTLYCVLSTGVTHLSNYTSMLTLAMITVERYFAICRPFQAERISTKSRAMKVIVIAWIVSLVFAFVFTISCFANGASHMTAIALILQTIPFFASMTTITALNVIIVRQLTGRGQAISAQESEARSERLQVVKLLIVTELVFFACVFPYYLVDFIFGTQELSKACLQSSPTGSCMSLKQLYCLMVSMKTLMYVNSAINPIIYNVMSSRYRQAFLDAFKCSRRGSADSAMYASSRF